MIVENNDGSLDGLARWEKLPDDVEVEAPAAPEVDEGDEASDDAPAGDEAAVEPDAEPADAEPKRPSRAKAK